MYKLIYTELYKIWKQKYLIAIIVCLVFLCLGYAYVCKLDEDKISINKNWKAELSNKLIDNQNILNNQDSELDFFEKEELKEEIEYIEIRLENNISDEDWREYIISNYLSYKSEDELEKEAESILKSIEQDDWRLYYSTLNDIYMKQYGEKPEDVEISDLMEEIRMRLEYDIKPSRMIPEWKEECMLEYFSNKHFLRIEYNQSSYQKNYETIEKLERQNKIIKYRLDNNIKSYGRVSLCNYMKKVIDFPIILLIAIVATVNIVCSEHMHGTLKNILTNRHNRRKVYLSKVLASFIIAGASCLMLFLISFIVGNIYWDYDVSNYLLMINGNVVSINFYLYLFIKYLLVLIECFTAETIVLMMSVIIENLIISLGMGVFVIIGIPKMLLYLYNTFKRGWVKYIPSLSYNFTQFLDDNILVYGLSVGSSILYSAVTIIICLSLGMYIFENENL